MNYGLEYHHANSVISYGRVVMTKEEAEEMAYEQLLLIKSFCNSAHTPNTIVDVKPTKLEL